MPSYGIVPALSSLRGAVGYFEHGLFGDGQAQQQDNAANQEERQSLLQGQPGTSSAAKPKQPASSSAGHAANGHVHSLELAAAPAATLSTRHAVQDQQHLQQQHLQSQQQQPQQQQQEEEEEHASEAVTPKQSKFDSLDYEVVENTVYRTDAAARTHLDHIMESGVKWTICFALGVITAAAAFAVNFGVENIAGFKFWVTLTLLDRKQALASYLVYVLINCSLIVGSVALTVLVAPAAAGSGIAEVKAYLNGIDVPSIFFFKTLVVKLTGSVGAVAGGLAVGKEGPFVHAGACLGALLSQGGSSKRHLPWFRRFWNDRDRADFVACGTAAGVAAAFRSPVGGVLFALEEMTSWFRNQLLWYAFFTTAVVSVAVRALMRICQSSQGQQGTCGFFGSGGYLLYEITEGQENFDIFELLPVLLLGVIGGLLGSCFTYLNEGLADWRKRVLLPHGTRGRLWEALAAALLTSTVSFLVPMMVACQPCPPGVSEACPRVDNTHSGNFVNFACPAGNQYHDLATIFFNTQDDAIRNLFSAQTKSEYSVSSLLTFSTMFFLLAVISYGVALPTGLFVPSILCGAAYGRLVGVFVADLRPAIGSESSIDECTYALLGAASFLGGCMRMTVATCVMLLELTNNLALLPLMMLVTLVAKAVGDGTGIKPIYESLMELKGLPFLVSHPDSLAHHITAAEAAGHPAVTFARVERVSAVVDVLKHTKHNGFAVLERGMDGEQHIMGIVLRSQLVVLLKSRRCFQPTSFVSELAGRVSFSYQGSDFVRPISEAADGMQGLILSDQEIAMYLDLGPYANPSYYVVQEDTSLSKVHTLFRQLGLRHVAVIPRASCVMGVITRHDLLPEALEETFMGQQAPLGAGAVGLASALRGTVRQALESFQSRAAPHRVSRHSRHSSTGSGTLGPLRSALGAAPVAATASPWQQQQQQHEQQQRRVSWAQMPLSPIGSAAYGVTGGPGLGRAGSTAAAAGSSISRLSSVTAGVSGQWADGPGAAAEGNAAAGGSAGGAVNSRGRLVLHTNKGQNSSRPVSPAAAAAPAALPVEPTPAAEAVPRAGSRAAMHSAVSSPTVRSGKTSPAPAAAAAPPPGVNPDAAAGAGAAAASVLVLRGSRSSSGPSGSGSGLPARLSSASSWSDFEAVGDEAPGAAGQQQQ